MAASAIMSIEQYLAHTPRPDVEYIDGHTEEKPEVGFIHGDVQGLLYMWFRQHAGEWGIRVSLDTRTRVSESRVRLPDLVVTNKLQPYEPGALEQPPILAIEVLSPDDTLKGLEHRAHDLDVMGTTCILLIDPEDRKVWKWDADLGWAGIGSLYNEPGHPYEIAAPIHLDFHWLWSELNSSMS